MCVLYCVVILRTILLNAVEFEYFIFLGNFVFYFIIDLRQFQAGILEGERPSLVYKCFLGCCETQRRRSEEKGPKSD